MKPISASSIRIKPSPAYHGAAVAGDPRVHSNNNNEIFHKMHQSPSSHTSSSSQQSRQSHHHSNISHQSEQPSTPLSGSQHQHFSPIQANSTQRHMSVTSAPQLLQTSTDFVSHMIVPNYIQPTSMSLTPGNVNTSLVNLQPHADPTTSVGFHQTFSPQFSQTSSPGLPPFPVPPPGQPPMNAIPVVRAQVYPNPANRYLPHYHY